MSDEKTAHEVAKWLRSLHRIINIQPVCVTLEGLPPYYGAMYRRMGTYTEGMGACTHGITLKDGSRVVKKPGEDYTENRTIYLVGRGPQGRKWKKVALTADGQEWYFSSYIIKENIKPEHKEFHPFGETFMIAEWEVPDGSKIDHYEEQPYRRVPMQIVKLQKNVGG